MYTPALENLRIVMVETSHPGNIGSAARAMKVMGIKDLRLVSPPQTFFTGNLCTGFWRE